MPRCSGVPEPGQNGVNRTAGPKEARSAPARVAATRGAGLRAGVHSSAAPSSSTGRGAPSGGTQVGPGSRGRSLPWGSPSALSLYEAGSHLAPRRQVRGDYLAEPGPLTSSKTGSLLFPGSIVIF